MLCYSTPNLIDCTIILTACAAKYIAVTAKKILPALFIFIDFNCFLLFVPCRVSLQMAVSLRSRLAPVSRLLALDTKN